MSSGGSTQGGWSGGAQADFTNNDAGDEQIASYAAHSGSQGWHYARGYNSPGQGTPYSPNVTAAVNTGDIFSASLWFKAASAADGSSVAIETGNLAGDDRANIVAYIENNAGGLTLRSFTNANFDAVPLFSNVDASVWHHLSFSLTKTSGFNDPISISLDGGSPLSFDGSLNTWRQSLGFGYSESSRLKFRARHADGDLTKNGFYFDDISYNTQAVPEPASLLVLGLGAVAMVRRKKA
ncbi:MAG: PEP-CTERM sorting domain-containing protein [Armatimonadetes bacterium]|nr:PEP-CTERM sorting domain-containing protein [Armatimonadota bacterium]